MTKSYIHMRKHGMITSNFKLPTTLLSALVVGVVFSSSSHAEIINGVFSGTVTSGYDTFNTFGLGIDANLAGQAITGTFTFDSTAFGSYYYGTTSINATGGPVYGSAIMNPPVVVTETINGMTLTSTGVGSSELVVFQNTPAYLSPSQGIVDTTGFGIGVSDINNTNGTIVDYFSTNSTSNIVNNINDLSTLSFSDINGTSLSTGFPWAGQIFFNGTNNNNNIFFSVTSETVGNFTSTVPLFESYVMMITGLGLMVWRKKR